MDDPHVSCSLLNALINVPEYMHGARSMQAIVEMSMLYEKDSWEEADLPSKDQLQLHHQKHRRILQTFGSKKAIMHRYQINALYQVN